jgi:SAM-dependent methyltransferase
MKEATRERLARGLQAVGLLRSGARLRERVLALRAGSSDATGPDGLPLPPARLRVAVDGRSADAGRFIRVGEQSAQRVRRAIAATGRDLSRFERILDFGCGCGRVARHWANLDGPEICGCDQNPELVEWCSRNLPFMSVRVNGVEPPTPYEDSSFELVYALSVLTHLPEELQSPWMAEFRRILRPDGLLLFTTLGERSKGRADARGRADFEAGRLVVKRSQLPGSNLCTVLHPYSYVTNGLLDGFSLLSFTEAASPQGQDTYLARRQR